MWLKVTILAKLQFFFHNFSREKKLFFVLKLCNFLTFDFFFRKQNVHLFHLIINRLKKKYWNRSSRSSNQLRRIFRRRKDGHTDIFAEQPPSMAHSPHFVPLASLHFVSYIECRAISVHCPPFGPHTALCLTVNTFIRTGHRIMARLDFSR